MGPGVVASLSGIEGWLLSERDSNPWASLVREKNIQEKKLLMSMISLKGSLKVFGERKRKWLSYKVVNCQLRLLENKLTNTCFMCLSFVPVGHSEPLSQPPCVWGWLLRPVACDLGQAVKGGSCEWFSDVTVILPCFHPAHVAMCFVKWEQRGEVTSGKLGIYLFNKYLLGVHPSRP